MPTIKNDMGEPLPKSSQKRPRFEEEGHFELTLLKIQKVIQKILSDQKYLQPKYKSELKQWIMDELSLKPDHAGRYMRMAIKEVRAIGKAKIEKAYQKAIRDREWVIMELKELIANETDVNKIQVYGKILDSMKDRDDLAGLYKQTIEHKGEISLKDINVSSLTDDQLKKLKELIKQGHPVNEALLHIGVIIKAKK